MIGVLEAGIGKETDSSSESPKGVQVYQNWFWTSISHFRLLTSIAIRHLYIYFMNIVNQATIHASFFCLCL